MKQILIVNKALLISLVLLCSCSRQTVKILQSDGNCPVIMEARTWNSITGAILGFELKITNNSESKLNNCSIIFDHKYKHTLEGLYSLDKGLIKDSVFNPHVTYTFQFSGDESNMIYFDIKDDNYVPSEITLESKECHIERKAEVRDNLLFPRIITLSNSYIKIKPA